MKFSTLANIDRRRPADAGLHRRGQGLCRPAASSSPPRAGTGASCGCPGNSRRRCARTLDQIGERLGMRGFLDLIADETVGTDVGPMRRAHGAGGSPGADHAGASPAVAGGGRDGGTSRSGSGRGVMACRAHRGRSAGRSRRRCRSGCGSRRDAVHSRARRAAVAGRDQPPVAPAAAPAAADGRDRSTIISVLERVRHRAARRLKCDPA